MGIYLLIAARNLMQARRRTFLLGGALAFVTVLLVLFQSLMQGATENMLRSATTLATGHVNVGAFYKETITSVAPLILDAPEMRRFVEENTPGVDYVIDRQLGFGKIVSDRASVMSAMSGIVPAQEPRLIESLTLAKESDYLPDGSDERKGDLSRIGEKGTIVIFANHAKRLKVQVGDAITITAQTYKGVTNSLQLTIVAVAEDIGFISMFSTFVAEADLRELYQLREDTTGVIMVYLKDPSKSAEVATHLRDVLAKKGHTLLEAESLPFHQKLQSVQSEDWTGQRVDVTTWEDELVMLTAITSGLNFIGFLLVFILLAIIVVGIINTMWISVRERTNEIGTLRAVGMQRRSVLTMFLTEAVLLGLGATVAGSLVGALIGAGLHAAQVKIPVDAFKMILMADTFQFALTPGQLVFSVVLLTGITGVSALWPALKAARMSPVTAIQAVN